MRLALFDLDNTLLAGDSDHSWGQFLCRNGYVDVAQYQARNDAFYTDYCAGNLDVEAFQSFTQEILGRTPMAVLKEWHAAFMTEVIEPMILPKGLVLIEQHRRAGDCLVMITATNRFVTGSIAARLGMHHLIATECAVQNGAYIGRMEGVACYQHGKVVRLQEWLTSTDMSLSESIFYTDSHNDLALLGQVTYPVAVDPDDTLKAFARSRGWAELSLR